MNKINAGKVDLHPAQKFVMQRIHRRSIKTAPYNPRQIDDHARNKLKGNLKAMGLQYPLVFNKRTGNLVSGHQRLDILDQLSKSGDDYSLDFAVVDLNEKDEKRQNVFFNNPDAMGTYDPDAIGKMIAAGDIDYKDAGFDDMSVQLLLEGTDYEVTMFDEDNAPKSVQDDLDQLDEIQRMKRERKAHRERDQKANDPEFIAVAVFPDRDVQARLMTMLGKSGDDRYVDGVRLLTALEASAPKTKEYDGEKFVKLVFWVAEDQKNVVENELTRIAALMHGKNIRGRALEAMAVISSQTPTSNITGEDPEEPEPKFKPRKRKRRTVA